MSVRKAQPFRSRKALVKHILGYTGKMGSLGRAFKRAAH